MAYTSTRRAHALGVSATAVSQATVASLPTPSVPTVAWAPPSMPPFNPADYDPTTFAQKQYAVWSGPAMQAKIAQGRSGLAKMLTIPLPTLPAMGQSDITNWTTSYVAVNGVPTNLADGAKMVTALAHAQADKIGVPPEWIAAADVLMHPPTSVADGITMVENVGKAYFMTYAVPLLQNELMSLSANLAMVAQGIPVQFAVAGFEAFASGTLSTEEIKGIAVQAAAYACGLLLQGLGIPAPLGALLSGVVVQGFTAAADEIINGSAMDADQSARAAAYDAIEAQRQALMSQCVTAAQTTWIKTQDFWEQLLGPVQALMDMPEVASRLQAAGGVRYYGRNTVTLPPGTILPGANPTYVQLVGEGAAAHLETLTYRQAGDWDAMFRQAVAAARAATLTAKKFAGTKDASKYAQLEAQARQNVTDIANKAAQQATLPLYQYGFDCLWWEGQLDSSYDESTALLRSSTPANARPFPNGCLYYGRAEPSGVWGGKNQTLDPNQWQQNPYWVDPTSSWDRCGSRGYSYPSFWSPDSAADCTVTMKGAGQFKYDPTVIGAESRIVVIRLTSYTDHQTPVVSRRAPVMRGALVDGHPSAQAALQFWGATRPVSPMNVGSGVSSDTAQWTQFAKLDPSTIEFTKSSATLNLPFNYCDVNQWADAVQIASAASTLVKQDIVRTVAWQHGAEQAAIVAAMQRQQASATLIAAQVKQAFLQATALRAARASSGAFAAALQARLSFQSAQVAAASRRKMLLVGGGLVAGALLLWAVYRKKHKT